MEAGDGGESRGLEYTPTWIVAGVSFLIILISLCVQRALYRLGKILKHKKQDALYEALEKLKEELMLLGFISLLLTVFQGVISEICVPTHLVSSMLPCKAHQGTEASASAPEHQQPYHEDSIRRHLLSSGPNKDTCAPKGQVPLMSLEGLHHLHVFIFVLAVVHVIFCATTFLLGGLRIQQWKHWEKSIQRAGEKTPSMHKEETLQHEILFMRRAGVYWRKAAVVSWTIAFCKQFYDSVTKSDYIALRRGFIQKHCPLYPSFDFHKYMSRAVDADFKKIVGISAFLWMFTIVFLLLNVEGWHTYFWLSFLPLILLLLVGAKLEHIIIRLAQETRTDKTDRESAEVKPSDDHFWFGKPVIVLHLIHFILFQNSFEIAFFFWIWCTYGFHSCIMEKFGYIIPRLMIGALVQVLCSYSTLPLYALVAQMGSSFNKDGMFEDHMQAGFSNWVNVIRGRGGGDDDRPSRPEASTQPRDHKLVTELNEISQDSESCSVHLHSIRDSPVP
ncbi:hypothetical protein SAY86_018653 [Trapa natans]|uniref:MLO-like protein n=1 Tax=Trapa natans TaxID=22666 RepID=A0AAN7LNA5_TRANT|nr:hypothetical protein SAY86_018653 [Trapa natans]